MLEVLKLLLAPGFRLCRRPLSWLRCLALRRRLCRPLRRLLVSVARLPGLPGRRRRRLLVGRGRFVAVAPFSLLVLLGLLLQLKEALM